GERTIFCCRDDDHDNFRETSWRGPFERDRRPQARMGSNASLGSLAPIGSQKPFWPPRRRCHSLHSNYMLNRGYAYTKIISSKYDGQTLLSHLASLYPHSTPQAWQQKLNNGEVTLNGVTATGSESVTLGQTLVWNRPPWIEPDSPQHFEVLFEDPHLLAVNKPSEIGRASCRERV